MIQQSLHWVCIHTPRLCSQGRRNVCAPLLLQVTHSSQSGESAHCGPAGKSKKLDHLSLAERKGSPPKDDDEFMVVFSKAEKCTEEITEIMQSLKSLQALQGNKEFENLIGTPCTSRFLKREVKKAKELLTKVTKQKLLEKKNSGLAHQEYIQNNHSSLIYQFFIVDQDVQSTHSFFLSSVLEL
ncbi:PREDICTED: centromere protein R isoform X2 [Chinchilla lanigera]|uniref:centromere protein R isoform X2 n=1 Tax=Chinchilla lanigera TaxID=34839 RepID=UPI00069816D1|nr:PREDICTED: centromere protein R isoform X2 [Chinchilla lanigera]